MMLECILLGDTIAQGISPLRPECAIYGRNGINSYEFNNRYLGRELYGEAVIISLGSYDKTTTKTMSELLALRDNVGGRRIYWILPANNSEIQAMIRSIAGLYKDNIIVIPEVSKNNITPTPNAYKRLAEITK